MSIQATDKPAGNRRRRKREIRLEIDRRADRPFNGDTATRLVADPYSTTGGKIAVTASLRDDPLGKLYARRQIDDAQYRVGLMLTEFFELAEIGSIQAVDPSKEPVDGRGALVETTTESQRRASRRLAHVREILGQVGYELCRAVCAEGKQMDEIAARVASVTETTIKYWGKRFRECLQTLAVGLGATRGHSPNDRHSELAIKYTEN